MCGWNMSGLLLSIFLSIIINGYDVYEVNEPIIYEENGIEIREYIDGNKMYIDLNKDIKEEVTCKFNYSLFDSDTNIVYSNDTSFVFSKSIDKKNISLINSENIKYYNVFTTCNIKNNTNETIISNSDLDKLEKSMKQSDLFALIILLVIFLIFIFSGIFSYINKRKKHKKIYEKLISNGFTNIDQDPNELIVGKYTNRNVVKNNDNIIIEIITFKDTKRASDYYSYVIEKLPKTDITSGYDDDKNKFQRSIFTYTNKVVYLMQKEELFIHGISQGNKKNSFIDLFNDIEE